MGDFRKDGGRRFGGFGRRDGGRGGFGGGGRDRGQVTMHQATCAQCGKSCEVPFKPFGDKPVYCNDCFGGKREAGDSRGAERFPRKNFDAYQAPRKPDFTGDIKKNTTDELKQLEQLNAKMDKLIKAVEGLATSRYFVAEDKVKEAAPAVKAKKAVKKVSKR
jgi:CxxC-x17-CxxC domain-containing protein